MAHKFHVRVTNKSGSNGLYSNLTDVDLTGQRLTVVDLKTKRLQDLDLSEVASIHITVEKEERT